jgi:hypothetical protein
MSNNSEILCILEIPMPENYLIVQTRHRLFYLSFFFIIFTFFLLLVYCLFLFFSFYFVVLVHSMDTTPIFKTIQNNGNLILVLKIILKNLMNCTEYIGFELNICCESIFNKHSPVPYVAKIDLVRLNLQRRNIYIFLEILSSKNNLKNGNKHKHSKWRLNSIGGECVFFFSI